jgi:hypothetical protein
MNEFANDFFGAIANPGPTIARVMDKKRWQAALLLVLLVSAIVTFITFPVTKVEQAKLIRDSQMAEKLSEEQLASLDKFTPTQRFMGALYALAFSGLTIVIGAFFIYLFFKVAGSEGNYVNFFSGAAQASILDMLLGGILKGTLILLKKTLIVHTGLTMFFPGLDFRSLPFIVLSQFDFFSLWYLAALALGIAVYAKISLKKSISVMVAYFLFKSLVFIAFSYLAMKLVGM